MAATCLDSMLDGYTGQLQTDGYAGYTSWLSRKSHATEKASIIHAASWAHARQKFKEVPGNPTAEAS